MRPRGLPIGNLTSQFWANVYLHELDMFAKHQLRCPAYLRYMDDFLLFSDDKQELNHWREAIRDFLAARLRLQLHPRKSVVFPVHTGLDFCGFRLFPHPPSLTQEQRTSLCAAIPLPAGRLPGRRPDLCRDEPVGAVLDCPRQPRRHLAAAAAHFSRLPVALLSAN
jgi:hypothetical protein